MEPDSEIEDIEIRLLLDAIHARYGYDLRGYSQGSLKRRVQTALARSGLDNLGELQHQLLHSQDFFASVFDDLTVRVSEMFRDPAVYLALRARVVPVLRTYPLLKVWHAGCASGEEVHSTAILLAEEGLAGRAQIYATDLSVGALEQARQGLYSARNLTAFDENYRRSGGTSTLSSYYTAAYDRIAMKESLRRNVLFFQHDLVADHVFGEMHLVFCRNVLIYFGDELRALVLRKLAQSLCPGGFLCLGSSERLTRAGPDEPFTEFAPEERIYRYEGQRANLG